MALMKVNRVNIIIYIKKKLLITFSAIILEQFKNNNRVTLINDMERKLKLPL